MIFLSGLFTGLIMGLTGSGGALVAIPLFMRLSDMDLKDASSLSLVAVFLAASLNFSPHWRKAQLSTVMILLPFSFLASYISVPLKQHLSDQMIVLLLIMISLYALYAVWKKIPETQPTHRSGKSHYLFASLTGLMLGVLTTFTGLGGGVMLIPICIRIFHLPMETAIPTSLLAVALSSLVSFLLQLESFHHSTALYFELAFGILISVFTLKIFLVKLPERLMLNLRRWVYTAVVALTVFNFVIQK